MFRLDVDETVVELVEGSEAFSAVLGLANAAVQSRILSKHTDRL